MRARRRDRVQAGRKQRRVRVGGSGIDGFERLDHRLADAAGRHVHHPPEAHIVVRIDDQTQIRQRVLDFLPLVEPDAADDAVGDAVAHERIFNRARLRVGAIQDGDHPVAIGALGLADGPRDVVRFFDLVRGADVADELAAALVGPETLVAAVPIAPDHGRRGVENDLRRPVVLLELDDLDVGKVLLEVEDVSEVGAAPLVDGLIRIADDAEVAMDLGETANEQVLRPVRVLVFVDEDVPELARVELADTRARLQRVDSVLSSRSSKSSADASVSARW